MSGGEGSRAADVAVTRRQGRGGGEEKVAVSVPGSWMGSCEELLFHSFPGKPQLIKSSETASVK